MDRLRVTLGLAATRAVVAGTRFSVPVTTRVGVRTLNICLGCGRLPIEASNRSALVHGAVCMQREVFSPTLGQRCYIATSRGRRALQVSPPTASVGGRARLLVTGALIIPYFLFSVVHAVKMINIVPVNRRLYWRALGSCAAYVLIDSVDGDSGEKEQAEQQSFHHSDLLTVGTLSMSAHGGPPPVRGDGLPWAISPRHLLPR